jgi:formate hydrogenlyase subunit 3/multisubunit Na+/H+ antiporter MnhD subunit
LLFGFLLLAAHTGSLTIASWHAVGPGAVHDVAWVLIVVGFGAKLGLVPLQVWIPVGYPAAPGPARAAMAGIAANVGVYGLWRFLGILGRPPVWLVIIVLLLGGITAVLGITFAGIQARLSRVIAYSSVENAGLIVTAYGVALTGAATGLPELVAVGLLAATLQTVAHAIAKSALFVSLANVEAATGTDELAALRGIGRRLRWSGAAFGAGAITLAGLPPTIGFVSEWFISRPCYRNSGSMGWPCDSASPVLVRWLPSPPDWRHWPSCVSWGWSSWESLRPPSADSRTRASAEKQVW